MDGTGVEIHERVVRADYFQFHLHRTDSDAVIDAAAGDIGLRDFGRAANITVASQAAPIEVRVEVRQSKPETIDPIWQHVAECSLAGSGGIELEDMLSSRHPAIPVPPSPLRMRVLWQGWQSGKRIERWSWRDGEIGSEKVLIQVWPDPEHRPAELLRNGAFKRANPFDHELPPVDQPTEVAGQTFMAHTPWEVDLLGRITGSNLGPGDQVVVSGFGDVERSSTIASILQGLGVADPELVIDPDSETRYASPTQIARSHGSSAASDLPGADPHLVHIHEHADGFATSVDGNTLAVLIAPMTHTTLIQLRGDRELWGVRIRATWDEYHSAAHAADG